MFLQYVSDKILWGKSGKGGKGEKGKIKKQAGAELCQAQWKLGLAKLDLPSMYFSYI